MPLNPNLKQCAKCLLEKDRTAFSKESRRSDGLATWCKSCYKGYRTDYYLTNREVERERNKEYKSGIRLWFNDYKSGCRCEKCGFAHPAALDFHHQDGEQKESDVAVLVHDGYSKERILEEIAKCIVLCANCHRIHHFGSMPLSSTG